MNGVIWSQRAAYYELRRVFALSECPSTAVEGKPQQRRCAQGMACPLPQLGDRDSGWCAAVNAFAASGLCWLLIAALGKPRNCPLGFGYQLDHCLIAAACVVGKGKKPVVQQDNALELAPVCAAARFGYLLCKHKARHHIGQNEHFIAKQFRQALGPALGVA
jgi:hypothetical protein